MFCWAHFLESSDFTTLFAFKSICKMKFCVNIPRISYNDELKNSQMRLYREGDTLLATTISSGFPDEYFCTSFNQFSIFSNVDKFVTSKTRNMASVLIYSSFLTSMYSGLPERSHRCTLTSKIQKKLYNVYYMYNIFLKIIPDIESIS